jgi:hypothetical protein
MQKQKTSMHIEINPDDDLLQQLPLQLLIRVITIVQLNDIIGFALAGKWYNRLLPRTYIMYPYIEEWYNPELLTDANSLIDKETVSEYAVIIEPVGICSYSIHKPSIIIEILEKDDIPAMKHLLAIGSVNNSTDIDHTDKRLLVQSPEMLKTIWGTKQIFNALHPITPTYIQIYAAMCIDNSPVLVDKLLQNEQKAWNITPRDFWNEILLGMDTVSINYPSVAIIIQILSDTNDMRETPLLSHALGTQASLLTIDSIVDFRQRLWLGMQPLSGLIAMLNSDNESGVVSVLEKILVHLPTYVLNSRGDNDKTVLQMLFEKRPLNRTVLDVFNKHVHYKRNNEIFY